MFRQFWKKDLSNWHDTVYVGMLGARSILGEKNGNLMIGTNEIWCRVLKSNDGER